jgi:hypothetical protein
MLLSNLIASHQESYADIQAKIEDLQEQQRKIQAYLQQLGSVESQMVSAVQMLQEAISSINEVCPNELAEYQQTVVGLFSSPVAMLESSQPDPEPEPQPDPAPSPEPEQPSNIVQFPGNATVEVKAEPTPNIIATTFYGHIGRGGHDHIVWRVFDNEKALQVFRRLNIKPSDISLTPAKNCNAGKGYFYDGEDSYTAIVTSKAFMKLINDGDMTRDKVLDD